MFKVYHIHIFIPATSSANLIAHKLHYNHYIINCQLTPRWQIVGHGWQSRGRAVGYGVKLVNFARAPVLGDA